MEFRIDPVGLPDLVCDIYRADHPDWPAQAAPSNATRCLVSCCQLGWHRSPSSCHMRASAVPLYTRVGRPSLFACDSRPSLICVGGPPLWVPQKRHIASRSPPRITSMMLVTPPKRPRQTFQMIEELNDCTKFGRTLSGICIVWRKH